MQLGTALQEVVDTIKPVIPETVIDPRDLNTPGAWVTAGDISFDILAAGSASMAFDIYLVVADTGIASSLDALSDLLAQLETVFAPETAKPVTVNLPNHSADGLPALLVTIQTTVS